MWTNLPFLQVFLRLDELICYTLFYFSMWIWWVNEAVFNTWMVTKSKWWFWTNLELIAGTGICTPSEGLEHGPIKFRDHFWFEFYFAYKMNNIASLLTLLSFIKNSRIHLKREWVHPESECFVAGVCVCVCLCVCVFLRPSTVKASSVWHVGYQGTDQGCYV